MKRRSAFKMTKRLFVIATEGRETEPRYFAEFNPERNGSFRLKILPNLQHKPSPLEVVKRLLEYQAQHRPGPDTEYWAVIDRDAWTEDELRKARDLISQQVEHHLALSNPCFELWLWLHSHPNRPFADRHDCQRSLRRECRWFRDKSDYDIAELMPHVGDACSRARAIDDEPDSPWPRHQGTRVYRLVEKLR